LKALNLPGFARLALTVRGRRLQTDLVRSFEA
jgi:hypothetical protein